MMRTEEQRFTDIIERYDPTSGYSLLEDLSGLERKTSDPDIIVPVIGMQGTGKSTLINALLGEDILPNEAYETTCIPVEIRFGKKEAVVYFSDENSEEIEFSKAVVSRYVDNVYNPGNEMHISHIVLKNEYPFLKNGIVIVDLPGAGSLTSENEQTAIRYIRELCAALILIPTSPPITASQAGFIKLIWRGISSAFFVQNIWVDDSEDEVREVLEYNNAVLAGIAEEIGISRKNGIIPVNVYNAAKGAFIDDKELVERSNIKQLKSILDDLAMNYREMVSRDFDGRMRDALNLIRCEIENRIRQKQMSKEELLNEIKKEKETFQDASDEIDRMIRDINKKISVLKQDSVKFSRELSSKKANALKADIFHLIEGGVTDGDQLNDAFVDLQLEYWTEAVDEDYEKMKEIYGELEKDLENLSDFVSIEKMKSHEAERFYKEQQFKWEKGARRGINIAGAIGGFFAGGAIGGPLGALAGIAVCLAGNVIGSGVERAKMNRRSDETKRQITPSIRKVEEKIRIEVENHLSSFFENCRKGLSDLESSRQEHLSEMSERISVILRSGNDIDEDLDLLNADLEYVTGYGEE